MDYQKGPKIFNNKPKFYEQKHIWMTFYNYFFTLLNILSTWVAIHKTFYNNLLHKTILNEC